MLTLGFTHGSKLTLVPGFLTTAVVGVAADTTLTGLGGVAPYNIQLVSEDLPAEWTISIPGDGTVIVATASAVTPGDFTVVFRIKDATRAVRIVERTLRVVALPLSVSGVLPDFDVGSAYTGVLTLSGGTPPYSAPFIAGLPDGITFDLIGDTFSLDGTPTGLGYGPGYSFPVPVYVQFQDSLGRAVEFNGTPTLTITPLSLSGALADATEDDPYSDSLARAGGVGDVTVVAQSGLPSALSAAADNVNDEVDITGTPAAGTATGSPYSPSITIEDDNGNQAVWSDSLVVIADTPVVVSGTLAAEIETGYPYSSTLAITGGSGVYSSVAVVSGAKPSWMSLAIVGTDVVASGTADDVGATYSFTLRVTDSAANTGDSGAQSVQVIGADWTPVVDNQTITWYSTLERNTTISGSNYTSWQGALTDPALTVVNPRLETSSSGRQPFTSTLNGIAAVNFSPSVVDDALRGNTSNTDLFVNAAGGLAWFIGKRGASNGATQGLFRGYTNASTARFQLSVNTATPGAMSFGGRRLDADAFLTWTGYTETTDVLNLAAYRDWANATAYLYNNGALKSSATSGTTGNTSNTAPSNSPVLAAQTDTGTAAANNLKIVEHGVITGQVTTGFLDRLAGYAAHRYQGNGADADFLATLDAANPYKNAKPVRKYTANLLHFDGANGSTVITDSSDRAMTFTATGNAALSTAQAKFGASSLLLDGAGDYITSQSHALYHIRTGDFTLEAWLWPTSSGLNAGNKCIFDMRATGTVSAVVPTLRLVSLVPQYITSNTARITAAGAISAATWTHVALSRVAGVTRLFVDGVQVGSNYADTNNYALAARLRIGASGNDALEGFAGHIDEFRFSEGIGRYTANFTPPAAPFT